MGTINQRLGNLIFMVRGHLRHNLTHHHELELQTSLTFLKRDKQIGNFVAVVHRWQFIIFHFPSSLIRAHQFALLCESEDLARRMAEWGINQP